MTRTDHPLRPDEHYVACPLCGADDAVVRFPATRRFLRSTSMAYFCCTNSYLAQHGDIVACRQCGMTYNNPQISPDMILDAYRHVIDPRYVEEKPGRERTFRLSLEQLHTHCRPPGRLLDVGCYTGVWMEVAAAQGWEVYGVELSSWAAEIARRSGVGPVYAGELAHIPHAAGAFDCVTAWDVIEHVAAPVEFLSRIADFMKPGGILALSTYLIDTLPVRLSGTHYPFFMEMHLIHFSRRTLQRMLAHCGYDIVGIVPHQRVVATAYFFEKLHSLLPIGKGISQPLLRLIQRWLHGKFTRIGYSGLVNIFARRRAQ